MRGHRTVVKLDDTRRIVLFCVDTPEGGFVAPFNPEEAVTIGQALLRYGGEAAHNIATNYRPPLIRKG